MSPPNEGFHPGLPMPRRWWAVAAIGLGTSLLVIDGTIANVALPTIARELGVSNGVVTNVVTVYQLVLVMFLLPFSSMGDRIGHRNLYQLGLVLFMVGSALCLVADNLWLLLGLRAVQGLGAAMSLSVSSAMLRAIYPSDRLGTGLGVNSVIVASSSALAPTLGGYIVGHFDWQWVFVAAAPLAIISLLLCRALPAPEPRGGKGNPISSSWNALTMLLIVGAFQLGTHGNAVLGLVIGALGLVSLIKLVGYEKQQAIPVLPVDLLAMPVIGLSALAAMTSFIAVTALMLSLPFRLQEVMGYEPTMVGLLLLPFPLTMLIISPFAGWLSDRVAPTKLGVAGLSIAIIGLLSLALMPENPSEWGIAFRLGLTAFGFGFFFSPNSRLLIGRAPRARAAAAGGVQSTARLLGQTFGAVVVGMLLATDVGLGPAPLLLAVALCIVAAACSFTRYRVRETR